MQNLVREFCVVGREFSNLRCLLNTLNTFCKVMHNWFSKCRSIFLVLNTFDNSTSLLPAADLIGGSLSLVNSLVTPSFLRDSSALFTFAIHSFSIQEMMSRMNEHSLALPGLQCPVNFCSQFNLQNNFSVPYQSLTFTLNMKPSTPHDYLYKVYLPVFVL